MLDIDKYDKILQNIASKVGADFVDIQKEFVEILTETKKKIKVDEDAERTSIMRLKNKYRSALRTNAAWWEGVIIGYQEPNYYLKRLYTANKTMYEDDPELAVREGYTDDTGEPLDSRKTLSSGAVNKNYGVPLKDLDYMNKAVMSVYGVVRKKDTEDLRPFKLTLFDEQVKLKIPLLQYVKFRANDRTGEDSEIYELSYSTATKFQVQPEFPEELQLHALLNKFDAVELEDLEAWHDQHENDMDAIVVTRGMVGSINLDTPEDKPYSFTLDTLDDDEDIVDEDGEIPDATYVQVPRYVNMDFAEGSIAFVIGRTWRGWDNQNNAPGNVSLTAYNVYVPEEYKVEVETTEPPAGSVAAPPSEEDKPKETEFF